MRPKWLAWAVVLASALPWWSEADRGAADVQLAYIGPGAGFAFLGSFLALFGSVLLSVLSLLAWPFRMAWRWVGRRQGYRHAHVNKLVFLGLDGLDPKLTERYMAEGKLPNLSRLKETGGYRRLRTTFPALSPVAWSTFATGVNPARHNIFDFLNRDLRSYLPELASARVLPPARVWRIGRWRIPLSRPTVEMRRKSDPFWKILSRHAISSTVLRVPVTFPPDEFDGRMLAAMSTPDLQGTQGTCTFFPGVREGFAAELAGPETCRVAFRLTQFDDAGATLELPGGACQRLTTGEFSPWLRLRFGRVPGIARFLLRRHGQGQALYVTPVQIDPEKPALPISHPPYYALYLSKLLGVYSTLGMAEDTWALNEGSLGEADFLAQAESIKQEREAMFFSALARTRRGVVACVFDTPDRVQHMFYRQHDAGGAHSAVIEDLYRDMDRLVGETLRRAGSDATVMVLSDHGFCSFRRGVNLNSWLHQHGYLVLQDPAASESGDYFEGVDWDRTRAYAVGLGGLYLNLRGREGRGTVEPTEAAALREELIARLTGLRDEALDAVAIRQVYATASLYKGPYLDAAPDLIAGYAEGYRISWDGATGKVSPAVFEDNHKAWSGDHCVDPVLVPGVLFSNRPMEATDPGLEDMAPTALALFGVARPAWMEGQPVFRFQ
ncbi:MAG: alkaline phosphatase family protein [Bryobacterales bacterium]|nr:alkaline phosphatase family protein [Bryobacterales bacterium]